MNELALVVIFIVLLLLMALGVFAGLARWEMRSNLKEARRQWEAKNRKDEDV